MLRVVLFLSQQSLVEALIVLLIRELLMLVVMVVVWATRHTYHGLGLVPMRSLRDALALQVVAVIMIIEHRAWLLREAIGGEVVQLGLILHRHHSVRAFTNKLFLYENRLLHFYGLRDGLVLEVV